MLAFWITENVNKTYDSKITILMHSNTQYYCTCNTCMVHVEWYSVEGVHFANCQQQDQGETIFASLENYLGMARSTLL